MKQITGNKTADQAIRIIGVAIIGYSGWQIYNTIKDNALFRANQGNSSNLPNPCNLNSITRHMINNEMDSIYKSVTGNIIYYPEHINKVLKYDKCQADYAAKYYKSNYGQTLYAAIYGDSWLSYPLYEAALEKLRQLGYNY